MVCCGVLWSETLLYPAQVLCGSVQILLGSLSELGCGHVVEQWVLRGLTTWGVGPKAALESLEGTEMGENVPAAYLMCLV